MDQTPVARETIIIIIHPAPELQQIVSFRQLNLTVVLALWGLSKSTSKTACVLKKLNIISEITKECHLSFVRLKLQFSYPKQK